jgi:hypothetical protein
MAVVTPVALRHINLLPTTLHKHSLHIFKRLVHDPQNVWTASNIEDRFLPRFSHDEANTNTFTLPLAMMSSTPCCVLVDQHLHVPGLVADYEYAVRAHFHKQYKNSPLDCRHSAAEQSRGHQNIYSYSSQKTNLPHTIFSSVRSTGEEGRDEASFNVNGTRRKLGEPSILLCDK